MIDHWRYHRTDDLVQEFADDYTILGGMKTWLGMEKKIPVDEDNLRYAYDCLDEITRTDILNYYIETNGLEEAFNDWYEDRYWDEDDPDDDDIDGIKADEAYEFARDAELVKKYGLLE